LFALKLNIYFQRIFRCAAAKSPSIAIGFISMATRLKNTVNAAYLAVGEEEF
jgi:hypothetical protein